jgi:hypothetical protein
LFSCTVTFCRTGRRVPPGVCCTTVTVGVDGAKKGLEGAVRGVLSDIAVFCYLCNRVYCRESLSIQVGFGDLFGDETFFLVSGLRGSCQAVEAMILHSHTTETRRAPEPFPAIKWSATGECFVLHTQQTPLTKSNFVQYRRALAKVGRCMARVLLCGRRVLKNLLSSSSVFLPFFWLM